LDISKLNRGEQIAGIAGIVLLLSMWIFDWFSYSGAASVGGISVNVGSIGGDAWQVFGFIDIIIFLAAISGIGLALVAASSTEVNAPVALSAITAGLGILATILILFRIISPPDQGFGDAVDVGRSFGVWLGLVASAAVAYGGWAAMQEEGATFTGGTTTGTGTPPPPPAPPAA
jgi:hypothetical protein